ncbi:MAG: rhomboid family intramembrane serine protease [Synechococcales cyanobacterium RM1_1_8]|nr:rhomboid family intramembrane serine protease [Synechococcales cyanobacterium RM1_1_8]
MANGKNEDKGNVRGELTLQFSILLALLGLMWGIEILDWLWAAQLDRYGIVPRDWVGLRGILFAPFLHGNFPHLMANTVPFFSLGWLVMLRRTRDFLWVTGLVMLLGGLGTWLIGNLFDPVLRSRPPVHIGASILIFGYLGYLLLRGWFDRQPASIIFSIAVALVYGGLLWGVLPGQAGVSWEGHLSGFVAGTIAAKLLAGRPAPPRRPAA